MTTTAVSTIQERALSLLGSGISPAVVAASLGVSESRISQMLSEDDFAAQVAALRYESLAQHNKRDGSYDKLEDLLLEKMEDCIPLMHRPMEILKAISIINAAKRRGTSTPEAITEKQQIIQLQIPVQIINKFATNLTGQVTAIGEQSLITIQSGSLDSLVQKRKETQNAHILFNREGASG